MCNFQNVFLIGPMGAGKTTVGRYLAKALMATFYDLDEAIEKESGVSIDTLFQQNGEAYFRQLEEKLLTKLTELSRIVLATGGGAVLSERNRNKLTQQGIVIYLKVSLSEQLRRLQDSHERPLLKSDDPAKILIKLQTQREPLYTAIADHIMDTSHLSAVDVARAILTTLQFPQSSL